MPIGETIDFFPTVSQPPRIGHLLPGGFLSHCFPATEKSVGHVGIFLAGGIFYSLMPLLYAGQYDLVHDDFGLVGIQTPFNPKKS